jgi:hypothetical protein
VRKRQGRGRGWEGERKGERATGDGEGIWGNVKESEKGERAEGEAKKNLKGSWRAQYW